MQWSHVGIIADILWHQIPHHHLNLELGAFVVMPNHVHGILIINNVDNVQTRHALSLQSTQSTQSEHAERSKQQIPSEQKTIGQQRFQNIGKNSISSMVGSYKSAVTKHANRLGFGFQWQSRFHDHIIRDDKSFQTISDYIVNNPVHWRKDKFFNPE
jgi:putative transposase